MATAVAIKLEYVVWSESATPTPQWRDYAAVIKAPKCKLQNRDYYEALRWFTWKPSVVSKGKAVLEISTKTHVTITCRRNDILASSPGPTQLSMLHAEKREGLVREVTWITS